MKKKIQLAIALILSLQITAFLAFVLSWTFLFIGGFVVFLTKFGKTPTETPPVLLTFSIFVAILWFTLSALIFFIISKLLLRLFSTDLSSLKSVTVFLYFALSGGAAFLVYKVSQNHTPLAFSLAYFTWNVVLFALYFQDIIRKQTTSENPPELNKSNIASKITIVIFLGLLILVARQLNDLNPLVRVFREESSTSDGKKANTNKERNTKETFPSTHILKSQSFVNSKGEKKNIAIITETPISKEKTIYSSSIYITDDSFTKSTALKSKDAGSIFFDPNAITISISSFKGEKFIFLFTFAGDGGLGWIFDQNGRTTSENVIETVYRTIPNVSSVQKNPFRIEWRNTDELYMTIEDNNNSSWRVLIDARTGQIVSTVKI